MWVNPYREIQQCETAVQARTADMLRLTSRRCTAAQGRSRRSDIVPQGMCEPRCGCSTPRFAWHATMWTCDLTHCHICNNAPRRTCTHRLYRPTVCLHPHKDHQFLTIECHPEAVQDVLDGRDGLVLVGQLLHLDLVSLKDSG